MALAPQGRDPVPLEARRSWARPIRRVYGVDSLLYPLCGGPMKVLAVIERPTIIRQILAHLGLPAVGPSLRAPPDPPDDSAADPPREWSDELFFDNLPVPDPRLG